MIDLSLEPEQQEILTAAADLLANEAPLSRLREATAEAALHAKLAEWGWFGVGVPDEEGGLGLGLAEEALLYLEAGRQLVAPSILATALAASLGPRELREAMQSGAARAALALPSDANEFYFFEPEGAALLVTVGEDDVRFFAAEDFSGEAVEGLDETLAMAKGSICGPPLHVGGEAARATLLLAAMLAGVAGGAAELTIEYAKFREQFGQPIGAFQAVKHRCADMGVAAFAAEAQLTMAAAALAERAAEARLELAAAVRQAIKAARSNAAAAIQVHGGMGFTAECDAHRFMKRAHVLSRLLGGDRRFDAVLTQVP